MESTDLSTPEFMFNDQGRVRNEGMDTTDDLTTMYQDEICTKNGIVLLTESELNFCNEDTNTYDISLPPTQESLFGNIRTEDLIPIELTGALSLENNNAMVESMDDQDLDQVDGPDTYNLNQILQHNVDRWLTIELVPNKDGTFEILQNPDNCIQTENETIDETTNNTVTDVESPPALSTVNYSPAPSTSAAVNNQRRPRGRPPKAHCSQPDPVELESLPEAERKRQLDRYRNNEASRQSRQNRKKKYNKQQEEEELLMAENAQLKEKAEKWKKINVQLTQMMFEEIKSWSM